jgi:hypothetical protein
LREQTRLRSTTGAIVPRGEVAFVPHLPARVITMTVRAGSTAPGSGMLAQIGSGE